MQQMTFCNAKSHVWQTVWFYKILCFTRNTNMIDLVFKYKLWHPSQAIRMLYYNFKRINRIKCFLVLAKHAMLDLDRTARIELRSSVIFGWCNMGKSRLETALCMARNSKIIFGGKNNGQIQVGYGSYIQVGENAELSIGDSFINREVKIICNKKMTIGDGCIIAMGTVIRDNDGARHRILSSDYANAKPVKIGNHVWLGENSMILKGVTIGDGAVVARHKRCSAALPRGRFAGESDT